MRRAEEITDLRNAAWAKSHDLHRVVEELRTP